jgi:hypothetical protein
VGWYECVAHRKPARARVDGAEIGRPKAWLPATAGPACVSHTKPQCSAASTAGTSSSLPTIARAYR